MNISSIKYETRKSLRGNWGKAIAVTLIYFAFYFLINIPEQLVRYVFHFQDITFEKNGLSIFSDPAKIMPSLIVSAIAAIVGFLIFTPLLYGEKYWYLKIANAQSPHVSALFEFLRSFKRYCKTLATRINIFLRIICFSILFLAPGIGLTVYFAHTINFLQATYFEILLMIACAALCIAGLWLLLMVWAGYFLTPYIIVQYPESSIRSAIKISLALMKGHRIRLFLLYLSFIGWVLLCILILPLLYVVPYMNATCARFAHYILNENKERSHPLDQTIEFSYTTK